MTITEAIEAAFAAETDEPPRAYIGASGIGHSCDAYLAFSLRGFPDTPVKPQLKRIFRDGHRIEDVVIEDLRKAGFRVEAVDPATGKQWAFSAYGGHVRAHADGVIWIDGKRCLLEIKSMNDARHHEASRLGIKASHPLYFKQMQLMMGYGRFDMGFLVAYNKNNSRYYAEKVLADPFEFSALKARAERVMAGDARKLSKDETHYVCRGCFKADTCWHGQRPPELKRTCDNARPDTDNGGWICAEGCKDTCENWVAYHPLPRV